MDTPTAAPDAAHLLTVHEVADLLGVHPQTVRQMARRGDVPALKLGGRTSPYRFRRSSIDAWLARREKRTTPRATTAAAI